MTARYELGVDAAAINAIDVHVHIEVDDDGHASLPRELVDAASSYFGSHERPSISAIADLYRELWMAAVVFTVDAQTQLGHRPIDSAWVARVACDNSDVLIPFGSVDPRTGAHAVSRARELVETAGVRGFKLHPTVQGFDPSATEYYPLYEELQRLGLPVIIHTGQTGIGARTRGGHGLRLGYSNPMLLDSVAADFPNLDIVFAHPSVPWQEEAISIATHKANVWIDLSGWSPKYFPESLVRASRTYLQDRVLFGSDYPLLHPQQWLSDFVNLGFDDAVAQKILRDNAIRLLQLDSKGTS